MSTPPVPYQITFPRLSGRTLALAELSSPLLDPDMHEDGRVGVSFGRLGEKQLTIDEFQMNSIVDYLANQSKLRAELETQLDQHHANWDSEKRFGRRPEVWNDVKVNHIEFDHRRVETRETIRKQYELLGSPADEAEIEQLYARSDKADTRSRFTLSLAADWFDAHGRMVNFRDCEVVQFILDG